MRNRLVMATQMWREATTEALPRMAPGEPAEQLAAFELKLIDMLCAQATADTARDVADKTWDLVHDRRGGRSRQAARRRVPTRRLPASPRGAAEPRSRLAPVRALPELFDVRVKARSIAYLFATGAALGLLTVAVPHPSEVNDLALVVLATGAIVIAAIVWVSRDRVREWHIHAVLLSGTLIVSLANYYAGPSTLYPVLYMWAGLYAFYFFGLGEALAHMAIVAASYAVVLAVQDPDSAVVRWLLAVGTPLVAGLLISRLLRLLSDRAQQLERSEVRTRTVLDTAPDAFITLDRDGVIITWNAAAQRLFGWTAAEAIGKTMRALLLPPEFGDRHDERRKALIASESPLATERFEVEFQRRDGGRFPGEATVSKVEIQGEVFVSGFITDVTERVRRQAEREALLREQAARAEAERVTELVAGMQALVDAALAHRTLDGILRELVAQVRGVLDADAATIYVVDEGERLSVGASAPADIGGDDEFAQTVAERREAMLARDGAGAEAGPLVGVPLLAEGEVTGVLVASAAPPREFGGEDLTLLQLAGERVGPRDRACARLRARAPDRRDAPAQPAPGPPTSAARP